MEQRRLRLGDILDDYCPRERRVTNHAVVAMIEEEVKQTRCTTCDAEHAYKGARVPARRKKETPGALYKEVLAGLPEVEASEASMLAVAVPVLPGSLPIPVVPALPVDALPRASREESDDVREHATDHGDGESRLVDAVSRHADAAEPPQDSEPSDVEMPEPLDDGAPVVEGPVHRRLIRATLPRIEGQKDARPIPEFTVRQAPTRGTGNGNGHGAGNFRNERMRMRGGGSPQGSPYGNRGNGNGNGNGGGRFHGGSGNRPSGSARPGSGRGGASPFRNGNSGPNGKRGRGSRG